MATIGSFFYGLYFLLVLFLVHVRLNYSHLLLIKLWLLAISHLHRRYFLEPRCSHRLLLLIASSSTPLRMDRISRNRIHLHDLINELILHLVLINDLILHRVVLQRALAADLFRSAYHGKRCDLPLLLLLNIFVGAAADSRHLGAPW
jgi:hypothetical protein